MPADYGLPRSDVRGRYETGESINRDWDWYVIRSSIDFTPSGDYNDTQQKRFELLLELFETKAQPAVIGPVYTTTETDPPDLPALNGLGPSTVYNMMLGVEHTEVWESLDDFLTALHNQYGFVYDVSAPTSNNVSLTRSEDLKRLP